MEENAISKTALMTAYARGYHALYDNPKIFNDDLAFNLLTEDERIYFDQLWVDRLKYTDPEMAKLAPDNASAIAWMLQVWTATSLIISRARYTEDILFSSIKEGIQEYVILGAGLDSFAFRYPDMLKQLHIFEIDHPTMQASKRQRLTELGWDCPPQLHFIPMDFTLESLKTVLNNSLSITQAPVFFSWLGVTYYLHQDTIFGILRDISSVAPTGSIIIFDYLDSTVFNLDTIPPRVRGVLKEVKRVGEPMISGLDPSSLAEKLSHIGLQLRQNLLPSDIQLLYFQGRKDHYTAFEYMNYACVVVAN